MNSLRLLVSFAAALVAAALPAQADRNWLHEVKFGIVANDVGDLWSGFRRETGVGIHAEAVFSPSVAIWGGVLRPAVGFTVGVDGGRTDRTTSKLFAGGRWTYDSPRGWFAGIGLGGAIHDGQLQLSDPDRKALGSRVLFHIPFQLGVHFSGNRSLSIYFDHISNGNLRKPNEGLDNLGIRYGYRF